MSSYYSVIIAYSIYFFFTSFRSELPWTGCHNPRWVSLKSLRETFDQISWFADNARLLELSKASTKLDPAWQSTDTCRRILSVSFKSTTFRIILTFLFPATKFCKCRMASNIPAASAGISWHVSSALGFLSTSPFGNPSSHQPKLDISQRAFPLYSSSSSSAAL